MHILYSVLYTKSERKTLNIKLYVNTCISLDYIFTVIEPCSRELSPFSPSHPCRLQCTLDCILLCFSQVPVQIYFKHFNWNHSCHLLWQLTPDNFNLVWKNVPLKTPSLMIPHSIQDSTLLPLASKMLTPLQKSKYNRDLADARNHNRSASWRQK